MPVIIEPADYAAWLDPAATDPDKLRPLFASLTAEQLIYSPVSMRVNSPANDDPLALRRRKSKKIFGTNENRGKICRVGATDCHILDIRHSTRHLEIKRHCHAIRFIMRPAASALPLTGRQT